MDKLQFIAYKIKNLQRERSYHRASLQHLEEELYDLHGKLFRVIDEIKSNPNGPIIPPASPDSVESHEDSAFAPGDRVKVVVGDRYHGRTGTIMAPHDSRRHFWWIELDFSPLGDPAERVFKAGSSLEKL